MNKSVLYKLGTATVISVALFSASACTSSSSGVSDTSASAGDSPKTGDLFSPLSELSYTPQAQGAYRIGANDLLEVNVFRVEELSKETRVDASGRISLPLVGVMKVAGMTQQQLEKTLAQKLSQSYLQNPQVSVFIKEQTSDEITVGGSVNRAGVFPLKGDTTISKAVAMAGGLQDIADPAKVVLFRPYGNGKFKAYNVNLKAIRDGKINDPYINGKDQIIVHQSGSKVWLRNVSGVLGGVLSPVGTFTGNVAR